MINKNSNELFDFSKVLFFIAIFVISYFLFYNQAFNGFGSDLLQHIRIIDEIIDGNTPLSYPMFHYLVYFTSNIIGISYELSAILINSFLVMLSSIIIYNILLIYLHRIISGAFILFLVFIITYSGNFYLPGLEITMYHFAGNGSISTWHNVTLFMVKPFSLLSFFLFFYSLNDKGSFSLKYFVISLIAALLSIIAKPSFIIVYIPMIITFTIYFYFNQSRFKIPLKIFLIYITIFLTMSLLILYLQYIMTFHSGASKIIFAPLKVWNIYSKNILVSIFISNMFIICFFIFAFKYLSIRSLFGFLMLGISILFFALLAEEGSQFSAGNFGWSYLLAQPIVFISVIIDLYKHYKSLNIYIKYLLLISLSLHLIGGIYMFGKIFIGMPYA